MANPSYSYHSTSQQAQTQAQAQGFFTPHSASNTESITPMKRWLAETSQQAPWNPIGSVGTSWSNTGARRSDNYGNRQQQADDNWSTSGNPSTRYI
ncbi:hypothetical protein DSL72_003553 [Monilinia vaccinii-corymbosi]|uniref:Uncharacterized protein n=1 Tax=Monilinia vaccinii-corymbosi TaxID=61207 RepID=A0A8A3NUB1_9HELO|nr:hypothetical protein DSL72_003553 [Monilinia vaccinii-corymbosi]